MNSKDYVVISRKGKRHYEHRWLWEQAFGPIPQGHDVHHIDGRRKGGCHLVCMPRSDHGAVSSLERRTRCHAKD